MELSAQGILQMKGIAGLPSAAHCGNGQPFGKPPAHTRTHNAVAFSGLKFIGKVIKQDGIAIHGVVRLTEPAQDTGTAFRRLLETGAKMAFRRKHRGQYR